MTLNSAAFTGGVLYAVLFIVMQWSSSLVWITSLVKKCIKASSFCLLYFQPNTCSYKALLLLTWEQLSSVCTFPQSISNFSAPITGYNDVFSIPHISICSIHPLLMLLLFLYLSFQWSLIESSLCITFCLKSLFCSPSHSQIHPNFLTQISPIQIFILFLFFPGFCYSPIPFLYPSLSWKCCYQNWYTCSLAKNNKWHLFKSEIAVWRLSGVSCRYCLHLWWV